MLRRAFILLGASSLAFASSGCPMSDDYYLLPEGASGSAGNAGGGSLVAGGGAGDAPDLAGAASDGGRAGSAVGGDATVSTGGSARCGSVTERCNGADDDCDDLVDELACPSGCSGFQLDGHGYMFCTTPNSRTTWPNAQAECSAQAQRLAWIETDAENGSLAAKLGSLSPDLVVYIGATDVAVEGTWRWEGGETFWVGDALGKPFGSAFSSWAEGRPNNAGNEDCAFLSPAEGTWNDASCLELFAYVCEEP